MRLELPAMNPVYRLAILAPAWAIVAPLPAEPTGPPAPVAARSSPAQQAMVDYKRNFGPVPLPAPCQRPKDNEVVVCGVGGRGGSPDRLPLPDERGPPDHPRLAVGEVRPDMSAPPGIATCTSQDPGTRCGGTVDLVGAAIAGVRLVRALVDPEGATTIDLNGSCRRRGRRRSASRCRSDMFRSPNVSCRSTAIGSWSIGGCRLGRCGPDCRVKSDVRRAL
jgi:hypothetical protein